MSPVIIAIKIAELIINKAFKPKNPISMTVIVILAHGLASKNDTTAGLDAPFLCNSMESAKIPCEQALIKKPRITEWKIVLFPLFANIKDMYSRGT